MSKKLEACSRCFSAPTLKGVSSDVPAVIPHEPDQARAAGPDVQLTPPESAQEACEPAWVALATPWVPGAAHGVAEAVLDRLQSVVAAEPAQAESAGQVIEVACELARDETLPPEARVAALQVGGAVAQTTVASQTYQPTKVGWGGRVLQVIGVGTVIGTVVSLVSRLNNGPQRYACASLVPSWRSPRIS